MVLAYEQPGQLSLVPFTSTEADTRNREGLLPLFLAFLVFTVHSMAMMSEVDSLVQWVGHCYSRSSRSLWGRKWSLIPVLTPT